MSLLQHAELTQGDLPFPVLSGRYEGFEVRLELVLDDMAVRKLPSLWLKVSLYAPVPFAGVFDLLIRPRGNEFYSPAFELPLEMKPPVGWPADAVIRRDEASRMPPETLARHLHLFDDPKMKELLITPRGVRLVYQFDQAERAHYAVLRQCQFVKPRVEPDLARLLLEAVASIYQSLATVSAQAMRARQGAPWQSDLQTERREHEVPT